MDTKTIKTISILSSVGLLAGLYYAFKNDKEFWGYVGYGLLGSIAGSASGQVVSSVIAKQ